MDGMNANLTCMTCRVIFAGGDLQREHYKSDWHRYNLKRKVANLPPVTAEIFKDKVLTYQEQVAEKQEEESIQKRCDACNKCFRSHETYINHTKSKKHIENEKVAQNNQNKDNKHKEVVPTFKQEPTKQDQEKVEAIEDDSGSSSSEWEEDGKLGLEECLFCSNVSDSLDENLKHMSVAHGFFIPDVNYCIDIVGMISYLGEKVALGEMCLWCSENKTFHSLDAVQKHMRDKQHCKIMHDSEHMMEYSDFYDYSSSYPDVESMEEGSSGGESEAYTAILEEKDWQLVLPSGATLGHRALKRYYKQNLRNEQRKPLTKPKSIQGIILDHYKALGWTGSSGEVAVRIARDMKFMQKLKSRKNMKLGVRGNKLRENCKPR